jgi:GxxExxY protein
MKLDDITYDIRGAIFEVNKVLGSGFLEKVYENALLIELKNRGLKVESQVPLKVTYKDEIVGEYFADMIVEEKVLVELKVIEKLNKLHEAQLLNYLHATGISVGLLVNFSYPKAKIKRFIL